MRKAAPVSRSGLFGFGWGALNGFALQSHLLRPIGWFGQAMSGAFV